MEALAWCLRQLELAADSPLEVDTIAGDASFRRYFRLRLDGRSWMLMDAPPAREDSRPFVEIDRRLRDGGVHAPRILAQDLERGWLLLEDLGDDLYRDMIDTVGIEPLLADAFPVLEAMADRVNCDGLPDYDEARLQQELDLFPDWYMARHRHAPFTDDELSVWHGLCRRLLDNAGEQPQVFVHRDFHSCNLLHLDEWSPGVIDFQDGVRGPLTYDLVSLLLDRYITWPRERLEQWMEQCRRRMAADVDERTWLRWCDWMGLQRNLKIVGIFSRLAYRDGKTHYLELIPRFADYVLDVVARYEEFRDCRAMLEQRLCAP